MLKAPLENGEEYIITAKMLETWQLRHPGLDVRFHVCQAIGWLEDHPQRRKTRRGMPAYFGNWLRRHDVPVVRAAREESFYTKSLLDQVSEDKIMETAKRWVEKHGFPLKKALELARGYYACPDRQGMAEYPE